VSKRNRGRLLDKYPRVEQPEAAEETGGKELEVDVIHLNYRDQPGTIRELLESLWIPRGGVDGEPEEMLTVRCAPNGEIVSLCPPPGRYFRRLPSQHDQNAAYELPVDVLKHE